jgi:hypothetical protein
MCPESLSMSVSVLIVATTNTTEIDMRQVSKTVITAFLKGENKTVGNTKTDGNALFLHGNMIALKDDCFLRISFCGWNTVTTRDRLNSLLFLAPEYGYQMDITGVCQRDFTPCLFMASGSIREVDDIGYYDVATLKGVLVS